MADLRTEILKMSNAKQVLFGFIARILVGAPLGGKQSLVIELVYHHRFPTYTAAHTAIFDYIETFYNRTRLHSSLAYLSPINFGSKLNQITLA